MINGWRAPGRWIAVAHLKRMPASFHRAEKTITVVTATGINMYEWIQSQAITPPLALYTRCVSCCKMACGSSNNLASFITFRTNSHQMTKHAYSLMRLWFVGEESGVHRNIFRKCDAYCIIIIYSYLISLFNATRLIVFPIRRNIMAVVYDAVFRLWIRTKWRLPLRSQYFGRFTCQCHLETKGHFIIP